MNVPNGNLSLVLKKPAESIYIDNFKIFALFVVIKDVLEPDNLFLEFISSSRSQQFWLIYREIYQVETD